MDPNTFKQLQDLLRYNEFEGLKYRMSQDPRLESQMRQMGRWPRSDSEPFGFHQQLIEGIQKRSGMLDPGNMDKGIYRDFGGMSIPQRNPGHFDRFLRDFGTDQQVMDMLKRLRQMGYSEDQINQYIQNYYKTRVNS